MKTVGVSKLSEENSRDLMKKISNTLLLAVCVLMLFSFSWILFDKGAVMVAERIVSLN